MHPDKHSSTDVNFPTHDPIKSQQHFHVWVEKLPGTRNGPEPPLHKKIRQKEAASNRQQYKELGYGT